MELTLQQQKRVDGIIAIVKDYLDVRFTHARRVNPRISHIYADVMWQQLATLRLVLTGGKSFGPVKYLVADILCSDDEPKRKALFNPVDQNSIMNEIVDVEEQKRDQRAGTLEIKDMRTMYKALDPSLEMVVELIQTWIWWDLPDAADLYNFDQQYQRIMTLHSRELTDQITGYYHKLFRRPGKEVTKQEVIDYEFKKLTAILDRCVIRRQTEAGYQIIIKREELPDTETDSLLLNLAKHIMAAQKLQNLPELDDNVKQYYQKVLGQPAEEIDITRAMAFEEKQISEGKAAMLRALNDEKAVGEPYDYKQAHLAQLQKRHNEMKAFLFPEEAEASAQ
jgi:hypothetical protein